MMTWLRVLIPLIVSGVTPPLFASAYYKSDSCFEFLQTGQVAHLMPATHAPIMGQRSHLTARRWLTPIKLNKSTEPEIEQISILVPVYRELHNGNIARLMQMVGAQTVDLSRVHLVLVVNNTVEIALDSNHPTLRENIDTVAWLNEIRPHLAFHLDVIDETRGFERNMGLLRNRALHFAVSQSSVKRRRHVLVNFDADSTMPPEYLKDLIYYYENFALDAVMARRAYTIPERASVKLFQSHHISVNQHLDFDLENILSYPSTGYSTPQITLRADVAADLGGFKPLVENEDLDLGIRLAAYTVVQAPDLMITQSDRVRADGFDAARKAKMILHLSDDDEFTVPYVFSHRLDHLALKSLYLFDRRLQDGINKGKLSRDEATDMFVRTADRAFFKDQLKLNDWRVADVHEYIDRLHAFAELNRQVYKGMIFFEMLLRPEAQNYLAKFHTSNAQYVYGVLDQYLRPDEQRRFDDLRAWRIRLNELEVQARNDDLERLIKNDNDFDSGPVPIDAFRRQLRDRTSPLRRDLEKQILIFRRDASVGLTLRRLTERYPSWLKCDREDAWGTDVVLKQALVDWFVRAQANPELYAGTTRYINRFY